MIRTTIRFQAICFCILIFVESPTAFAQTRKVGGFATIGEVNQPGVGGIRISIKGTSTETVSDNDGEYRINISDHDAVLVFSYPGMIAQEIAVGERSRIDVDLEKIPMPAPQTFEATDIGIVLNENTSQIEKNVADVLKRRLQQHSQVEVDISQQPNESSDLKIYLGIANKSERLDRLCNDHHVILPGRRMPAAEGYAVKMLEINGAPVIIAVGIDHRAVLYAAGEILRQVKANPLSVSFKTFAISTAPAYRFRGGNDSQGGSMRKITGARAWTSEEWQRTMLDYALAGANCFYGSWNEGGVRNDFIKSFDLMSTVGIRPNEYEEEYPVEWKASGLSAWEGDKWICPSIPEARATLIEQWTKKIEDLGEHDILRFYAGDPGGCRCDRCMPWGKTFALLSKDIARIALEKNPDLTVMLANQDLSNEGDQALFDYLASKPQPWLYGLAYGPGSNAMSWYFRRELNDEMFAYPGNGWLNRYLAETLNSLPKDQKIVHYSDITHWILSQYNVEHPERNIVKSYGRRTWHTRPRALHKIFQAIMPFSQGDIIYTEGYHDHFNQYFWQRLLWNPHQEADEVVQDYCGINFGEDASQLMGEAIFQLESNLEEPLATNSGIDRYYAFVKEAGTLIPENLMKHNHLWRLFMQKGSLDKYNRLKLQRELFKEERVRWLLKKAFESNDFGTALEQSLAVLAEPAETPAMATYRAEAEQLGLESEKIFGIRNVGYFNLDQPLREISKHEEMLKKAAALDSKSEQKEMMESVIQNTYKKTRYGRG